MKKENREKILLIILLVIFLFGFIIWFRYYRPKISSFLSPKTEIFTSEIKKIKLNLEILENPKLKNLEPFPQIEPPREEEIGKENPFSTSTFSTTSH